MGVLVKPKCVAFLTIASLGLLCGIGVAVYFYKISLVNQRNSSSNHIHIFTDENEFLNDQPPIQNVPIPTNQTVCVGAEYECHIRLDENVRPLHYELYLNPDIENGTFSGTVSIVLKTQAPVTHIRLHTKYLSITETLLIRGLDNVPIKRAFEVPEKEYWVVIPESPLEASRYNLTMTFNGILTRGITGFYRSTYVDGATNSTKYVVSTKFQPTSARKAFPCFDEPGFKSTFTITLVKPSSLVALSNMPAESEMSDTPSEGLTTVKFQKTVKMVT